MVEVRTAAGKDKISQIEALLDFGGEVDIAVAYLDMYGLNLIEKRINSLGPTIQRVRFLVDLKSLSTHPNAVKRLVELANEEGDRFRCKEFYTEEHKHAVLHSKLLIATDGDSVVFLTGSCNLTKNALVRNRERGLLVQCGNDKRLATETRGFFDGLWDDEHS